MTVPIVNIMWHLFFWTRCKRVRRIYKHRKVNARYTRHFFEREISLKISLHHYREIFKHRLTWAIS